MKKTQASPLISPGWSHYIVTTPLSPRAHVSISKQVREFSEQDAAFSPLGSSALNIAVLDLGILPESLEPLLCQALFQGVKNHASMRLQASQFQVAQPEQKKSAYLWLEFKDRVGAFSMLATDLKQKLAQLVPTALTPSPFGQSQKNKLSKEKCYLLCGQISSYKSDGYDQRFSVSSWVNDLHLQKRPSHFIPIKGYQSVWSYSLPLETPELVDEDIDIAERDADLFHNSKTKKIRLSYPLEGKDLSIFNQLEARIKESQAHQVSPLQNHHSKSKSRHKRRKKSS